MNMIDHQAIRPDRTIICDIGSTIITKKQGLLAPVFPLNDMMRPARRHDDCDSCILIRLRRIPLAPLAFATAVKNSFHLMNFSGQALGPAPTSLAGLNPLPLFPRKDPALGCPAMGLKTSRLKNSAC
jgi:hypothetical protein